MKNLLKMMLCALGLGLLGLVIFGPIGASIGGAIGFGIGSSLED